MPKKSVKLYGGAGHGTIYKLNDPPPLRLDFAQRPHEVDRYSMRDPLAPVEGGYFEHVTYHIQEWREVGQAPSRTRVRLIGLLEGAELLPHELALLERDMRRIPWELAPGNILTNFNQWFAACVYRHTGLVTWRGEPI